jgi:hypothetical protein
MNARGVETKLNQLRQKGTHLDRRNTAVVGFAATRIAHSTHTNKTSCIRQMAPDGLDGTNLKPHPRGRSVYCDASFYRHAEWSCQRQLLAELKHLVLGARGVENDNS